LVLQVVLLARLALRHLATVLLEFDLHFVLRGQFLELQDLLGWNIIVLDIAQVQANIAIGSINYLLWEEDHTGKRS
jgi:hypothetical protein